MRAALIVSALFGLAALPGAALAEGFGRPCTDKPKSDYLSLEALKAKVVEQGYQVRKGEISKACAEFYVLDKNGKRHELFLDPTTGKILGGDGKGASGMIGDDQAIVVASNDRDDVRRGGKDRDGDD